MIVVRVVIFTLLITAVILLLLQLARRESQKPIQSHPAGFLQLVQVWTFTRRSKRLAVLAVLPDKVYQGQRVY